MISNYRDATVHLCDLVESHIVDGSLSLGEGTFADVWLHSLPGFRVSVHASDHVEYVVDDEVAFFLVEEAKSNPEVFQVVAELCGINILGGHELPFALRYFAHAVLAGECTKPKFNHRPPKTNWFEKAALFSLAQEAATRFSLPLTRNDVSAPYSACDAVAEALTVCGRKTSYLEVKNICTHPDHATFRSQMEWSLVLDKHKGFLEEGKKGSS